MLDSVSGIPLPYISLEQAVTNIIESISKEEAAVANILNSESEVVQKVKEYSDDVEDFICLNKSVNDIIKNVVRLQMLLQIKLEEARTLLQSHENYDELEE